MIATSLGCDARLSYSVKVLDEKKLPVKDAWVEIRTACDTTIVPVSFSKTNSEGIANGAIIGPGEGSFYTFIHADGFQDYCRETYFRESGNQVEAVLERILTDESNE